MSLLSRIFGRNKVKTATVTLVGPSKAGKTTLVRYIETGQEVTDTIHTTLGIDIRRTPVDIDGWSIRAIDTGGQELYQHTFWELAIGQADSVIFVMDSTVRPENNRELYELTLSQFQYAIDIMPEDMPLLVLLNKQDLVTANPMKTGEASALFNRVLFDGRNAAYYGISAKYGTGVENAMSWLLDNM